MTTTIHIQNLKCGGCANTIITKLSEIDSVTNVSVSVQESAVTINHSSPTALNALKQKLAAIGYPEVGDKNSVLDKAKSFVSCATGKMSS